MNIRNIEKQDLGSLSQLYWDCFTEELTWEKWTTWTASKLLNFFYDKQKDLFFLAEIDWRIVWAVVFIVKPWRDGNLLVDGEIFVHPDFQKEWIGSKLLYRCIYKAREEYNCRYICAITFSNYKHPLNYYLKLWFEVDKERIIIWGKSDLILKNLEQCYLQENQL